MLKTFDIVLICVMTAMASLTYTIKHRAELKLEEVHRLEAEIKLETDTIDLLNADWALVTQPNRLERLVNVYNDDLKLQPTVSTALVHAAELPMLRTQLPPQDIADGKADPKGQAASGKPTSKADNLDDEIRKVIADVASKPAPKPVAKVTKPLGKTLAKAPAVAKRAQPETDDISTGSVDGD